MLAQPAVPSEITRFTDDFVRQGCTILLAFVHANPGLSITGDKQAVIVYESPKGIKMFWAMAGSIVDGLFETSIGRQHPIEEAQWQELKQKHTS